MLYLLVCLVVYEADDDASSKEGEDESRLSAEGGASLEDQGSSALDGSEGREQRSDDMKEGVRMMSKEMIAQEKALEEEYTKRQSEFDLQRELEKVHCSKYLERLVEMGFADAVSEIRTSIDMIAHFNSNTCGYRLRARSHT